MHFIYKIYGKIKGKNRDYRMLIGKIIIDVKFRGHKIFRTLKMTV